MTLGRRVRFIFRGRLLGQILSSLCKLHLDLDTSMWDWKANISFFVGGGCSKSQLESTIWSQESWADMLLWHCFLLRRRWGLVAIAPWPQVREVIQWWVWWVIHPVPQHVKLNKMRTMGLSYPGRKTRSFSPVHLLGNGRTACHPLCETCTSNCSYA